MQVFPIAPAGARPLWVLVVAGVLLLTVLAVLMVSILGSRRARFELSDAGLRLRGDWYGRFIPASALVADRAVRVDPVLAPHLRPVRRTFGTGLPGYQSGWFRLASGETALLYVTDSRKLVHVPTTLGYHLLLSPDDPDAFLEALRSAGTTRR